MKYLSEWGGKFFEPIEYRIKEITDRIEGNLQGSINLKIKPADLGLSAASKLSKEEKAEIVHRGQSVINEIQLRELTNVLEFLNEDVFDGEKQNFHICIDKLDENWVDEKFRYMLIRSLIDTVRDFLLQTSHLL